MVIEFANQYYKEVEDILPDKIVKLSKRED